MCSEELQESLKSWTWWRKHFPFLRMFQVSKEDCGDDGDDLGPCKPSLPGETHLLKPSHLSQRRRTHQEIIQLPPLSLSVLQPPLIYFKAGFHSVTMSRIPSSCRAPVCFWHQAASEGVTAGWASDVKHVCFLGFWWLNQAEDEGSMLDLHLRHKTSWGSTSSMSVSEEAALTLK